MYICTQKYTYMFLFVYTCYRTGEGWFMTNYYRKDPPFLSLEVPTPTHTRRQRKDVSQCQRLVKRKEIIYLKVAQT